MIEIRELPDHDTILTIQNNFNTLTTYQIIKENDLTKIARIALTPIQSTDTICDDINYTALALSYMHSNNIRSFLENNAAKNKDIPNSNIYIIARNWLVKNTIHNSLYIFNENNIEAKTV